MPKGPLQVLVINFDESNFSGSIEAELRRLEAAGTLRVLDLLLVVKNHEGAIEVLRSQAEIGEKLLGGKPSEDRELTSDEWAIADAIEPGAAAAIAVLEHTWAIPLYEAIESAGGHHVVAESVTEEQLADLGVPLTP